MTFWGVEVKPGKPFTLKYGDLDGKLILTQATLGTGSSTKKSILQCNVGEKSPVFLCTLLPEKSECCSLTLEFDEEDDVKFSVVGPTSIHLSGFVQGDPQDSYGDGCEDDCCGEDIAETESEESDYDSEDDFIDDDGMTMYPPSHVRNSGVVIEEIVDDEKAPCENGKTKQPKKKNKLAESNNDQKALVVNGDVSILESEDEDGFPVSSSHRSEPSSEKHDTERAGEDGKKNKKAYNAKDDDEGAKNLKRKVDAIDHDEEPKRKAGQEKDSAGATDVPSDEVVNKKKKKKVKAQETDATEGDTVAKNKDASNTGSSKSENVQNGDRTDAADAVTGDATKKKKNRKKKKVEKTENGEVCAVTEQDVGTEALKMSATDKVAKQSKAKSAKVRTFPNGFIIEELQMGKPNGKRASRGSKVSVRYIGKLQKNGKQFDSNIGRAPFKFRLGVGQVIKGWDVGVEGMRIGDKRRLIVPPSMGYGQNGAPPQIPSNAWLVFDVELIDVA